MLEIALSRLELVPELKVGFCFISLTDAYRDQKYDGLQESGGG